MYSIFRTLRFDSGESMRTRNSQALWILKNFYSVQNSYNRRVDRISKSILQNKCFFKFKFGITEDRYIFTLQEKPKEKPQGIHML